MEGIYKNLKTGVNYLMVNSNIIDTTNSRCGLRVVGYTNIENTQIYVRDIDEFLEKFIFIREITKEDMKLVKDHMNDHY